MEAAPGRPFVRCRNSRLSSVAAFLRQHPRIARDLRCARCQKLPSDEALASAAATVLAAQPSQAIYEFVGDLTMYDEALEGGATQDSLGLENTLWANTVLASNSAVGLVLYTGRETRSAMNTARPSSKIATVDLQAAPKKRFSSCWHDEIAHVIARVLPQVNLLAKVLFVLTAGTSFAMVAVPFFQRAAKFGFNPDVTQQLLQVPSRKLASESAATWIQLALTWLPGAAGFHTLHGPLLLHYPHFAACANPVSNHLLARPHVLCSAPRDSRASSRNIMLRVLHRRRP